MESATDKFLLGAVTFAADLEREKGRQRTYDAMLRKARAGHVTGGRVFGYENVVADTGGKRHLIVDDEADVVREIFDQYANGAGVRTIAKRLNEARRLCPRAQRGRPSAWAPSSVLEVLHRPIYRGELVWNQTRKRNQWGVKVQAARAEQDWVRIPAPELRVVPETLWQAVQTRAECARMTYLKATGGAAWGRPSHASSESKYLLTGFTRCHDCGGSLVVRSRSHGSRRAFWYACSSFHHRGRAVCPNSLEVRIDQANDAILSDLEKFVLHPKVVARAIALAMEELRPSRDRSARDQERLEKDRRTVEAEIGNLTRALAAGGDLPSLVAALQQAERHRQLVDAALTASRMESTAVTARGASDLKAQVLATVADWRTTLRQAAPEARRILRQLITDRIVLEATERDGKRVYRYRGMFTIGGLFEGTICPQTLASPRRLSKVDRVGGPLRRVAA